MENNKSNFHIFDYLNYKKVGDELDLDLILIDGDDYKSEKKKVKLQGSDYYKVRAKYPDFENIDYQILGGMVIMELTSNHFQEFEDDENNKKGKQIQKFNRLDEFTKPKLIITKIIKGSSLAEDNIFIAPCILSEVNGIEVTDLKELREALPKFKINNGHKYISFLTENHKFIILDIHKIKDEEDFLSKKFNYEITNYTKKLLGYYESKKTKSEQAKEVHSPPAEKLPPSQ